MLEFKPIPVNQYNKTVEDEKENFSKEDFLKIFHDMVVIREFETLLNLINIRGEYYEISYNHPGPAHLSIGQEAAAVGMAYTLDVDDFIFGSHRSHGEILAKGLSAISKLDDETLVNIMETHFDGKTLAPVKAGHKGTVKELAVKFLIYGTLAEIFARETGFNKGLGGSMHAFFTPSAFIPIMPLWAARAIFQWALHCIKKSTAKKELWWQHWRCFHGLRPGLGRFGFCYHGSV
jgi:2-oxoisovalerate dehydrogenase E1 component